MIVKIQRPLESTEVKPPALVYDKDRLIYSYVDFTPELAKAMGPKLKVYCEIEIHEGQIHIIKEVPPENW